MEPTRITVTEAKERLDRGEPLVFIDSRNSKAWASSAARLPGAIRVPADEVESHLQEMPKNRAIVTYCTGPYEASSARVAQILLDHGFKNVHPLYGGFDAWQEAGYPVESKEAHSSKGAGDHGNVGAAKASFLIQTNDQQIRDNLEHHVAEEKREMFRKARKVLSNQEAEELGEKMEAAKKNLQPQLVVGTGDHALACTDGRCCRPFGRGSR